MQQLNAFKPFHLDSETTHPPFQTNAPDFHSRASGANAWANQGTICGQIYWFSQDQGSASARARLQAASGAKWSALVNSSKWKLARASFSCITSCIQWISIMNIHQTFNLITPSTQKKPSLPLWRWKAWCNSSRRWSWKARWRVQPWQGLHERFWTHLSW